MTFEKLSDKQKQVFRWPYTDDYKAIICDGAVRSGKTVCMVTSFILWAMKEFDHACFGICGKTVASAERNLIQPVQTIADLTVYFKVTYSLKTHMLTVKAAERENYFFVFGGKDESSYQLVQGITLSGVLLDEVALMPKSFVNQVLARTLSVEKAKYWFNCNPEGPSHWFYKEWVSQPEKKNALHIHFLMCDNPTLTESMIRQAEAQFEGVFYERYIKGRWVVAQGLIYPMYEEIFAEPPEGEADEYAISIDYGTHNPFAALLWGKYGKVWHIVAEYYYSGRDEGRLKTDSEYGKELDDFIDEYLRRFCKEDESYIPPRLDVVIDPSAASFIALLMRKDRYHVIAADNSVLTGIRNTQTAMRKGLIKISKKCRAAKKEMQGYAWDEKAQEDKPLKINDHAMDAMRYFVQTKHLVSFRSDSKPIWLY